VQAIIDLIEESYPESNANLTEEVLATLTELYENHVLAAA
jgi:hypothetical protein